MTIKSVLKEYEFNPGVLGIFVNPFYFARTGIYRFLITLSEFNGQKILDVGCGSKPYTALFPDSEYTGLEIAGNTRSKADCFYDGKVFPFGNKSFDVVLVTEVLEHIPDPDAFLYEIRRVLADPGFLVITVPFAWREHEQPHDYIRYTSFGIRYTLNKNGFRIVRQEKSVTGFRALCQLINARVCQAAWSDHVLSNAVWTFLIMAPINVMGVVGGCILPGGDEFYLDNLIVATKTGDCV